MTARQCSPATLRQHQEARPRNKSGETMKGGMAGNGTKLPFLPQGLNGKFRTMSCRSLSGPCNTS